MGTRRRPDSGDASFRPRSPRPFRRAFPPAARSYSPEREAVLPSPEPEKIAARIIARCDRKHPADAVLREALREARGLAREKGREVAHAVFAYFRWFGWLSLADHVERRIQAARDLNRRFHDQPDSFADDELVQRVVPGWVRELAEVTPAWARSLQTEPKLWLRARPNRAQAVSRALGRCARLTSMPLRDTLLYEGDEDLYRSEVFQSGGFEVQDISSQAVGWLAAPQPHETWWDACAGEGGKTLHLSDLMDNTGLIWATDRAEWRLKILRRRAARAQAFNHRSTVWDGSARLPVRTLFDGILVDAPCSGLGTWQRNPHARWTTTKKDVEELARLQEQLLHHAVPALKPGGKLIYAVCTLAAAETTGIVHRLAERHPELEPWPVRSPFNAAGPVQPQHWFRPEERGGNGMFVALWRRAG